MAKEKGLWVVLVVCVVGALCPLAWGRYGGGSGTASDPYLIYTAEHLKDMGAYRREAGYYAHYKFMADIDLNDVPMEPLGTAEARFTGRVNGNGKTIANLKLVASSGDNIGLFGYAEGEFRDLGFIDVEIKAPQSKAVGVLAGTLVGGRMERCYVSGGTVSGRDRTGGLVGDTGASVHQCYVACSVSGYEWVGGLLGIHWGPGSVSQCYSTSKVSGAGSIGGLVGVGTSVIRDCYATGEVLGGLQAGGLVGSGASDGVIWNCYAAGRVRSYWAVGGLVGGSAICCSSFWDNQKSGLTANLFGVGKTTAELRTSATFVGWGCGMAWTIDEGRDYPRLAWENKPGVPLSTPAFPESLGQGTAEKPYLIRTAQELAAIAEFVGEWDKHYRLECDIDLAGLEEPFRIIGSYSAPFTGVFDGNGHSISNFEYSTNQSYAGLFGATRKAVIKKLTLINPRLDQGLYSWSGRVAPLIGWQVEGTVETCGVEGGVVVASHMLGGLIGESYRGTITRCYSTCKINGYHEPRDMGGLLGQGERCNINNCYTRGAIAAGENVGGLIGKNYYGNVSHCYAATVLDGGTNVGGLIGLPIQTLATACFWDIQTTEQTIGVLGTGASTAALQKAATFIKAGWDFAGERTNGTADIWCIDEGRDYPRFCLEPVAPPKRVWADDFEDGTPEPLWQVYEPTPAFARIREIDGRLELNVPTVPENSVSAACLSKGWTLDGSQDFSLKVDFHFTGSGLGEAWVSIGLTPDATTPIRRRLEFTAGCLGEEPVHTATRADGVGFATWWTARGCDNGTLYLSYDAAADELYLSHTGYGPANAWRIVTGLLKDRWSGGPVHVVLAGGSDGMKIEAAEASLDNFAVDTGTVLE